MITLASQQNKTSSQGLQPSEMKSVDRLQLGRSERWELSQKEIAQIPRALPGFEFNKLRDAVWARWGI